MAGGHSSTEDNVASLMHMFYLETPPEIPIEDFLSSFAAHTSDMGAELGVADFCGGTDVSPGWYSRGIPEVDVVNDDAVEERDGGILY